MRSYLQLVVVPLIFLISGCASISTWSHRQPGQPVFFSGTRLNLHAIIQSDTSPEKFAVDAPGYPLLDFVPSATADVLVLPATLSSAIYLSVVE